MLDRLVIEYLPVEDRLEIVIFTKAPVQEYRLHLTRRLTRHWLAQLAQVIEISAGAPSSADPTFRAAISALHHESLAAQANIGRTRISRSVAAASDAAACPELVTRVDCGRHRSAQRWTLRFSFGKEGKSVSLNLTPKTLHGMIELLSRQLEKTDWQLRLPVARNLQFPGVAAALH